VCSALAALTILAGSCWSIARPPKYQYTAAADWRSASTYILKNEKVGDGGIFLIANPYAYLYYAHRAQEQHSSVLPMDVLYPPEPFERATADEIAHITAGRDRVWVVWHLEKPGSSEWSMVHSVLVHAYDLQNEHVFSGSNAITVDLYTRRPLTP
jgi:hypothetical protein